MVAVGTDLSAKRVEQMELSEALREFHTETGRSLLELVDASPVLLIFLRHFSCAFCAQTPNMRGGRIRDPARGTTHLASSPLAHKSFKSFR